MTEANIPVAGKQPVTPAQLHAKFRMRYASSDSSAFSLDVDLRLPGNGITAVFGQSGSGKTTLLRCVAGLERAQPGHLTINGETWQSPTLFLPTHRRPLGYVFQEPSLFPHLSARGNLNYARKRAGVGSSDDLYEQVIELMGIKPMLLRYPHELSGGERQRVAIARALLIQPRLLLMDEPLASLDTARKQEILPYLEKLRSAFDIPILYVSHSLDEVTHLADHLVVLQQGRVAAQGPVGEVFSRMDAFQLVGSDASVIWQGKVIERKEQWHLARIACAGGDLWVRDTGDASGQQVRVRILARDVSLTLSRHEDSSILNRLPVCVLQIATDKEAGMALVRLQAGSDVVTAQVTHRSVDYLQLAPGQRLWAQIKSVAIVR